MPYMPTSRGLVPFPPPRRHGRIALRPCPFEHDEPSKLTILHISDANGRGFAVGCDCGAQGPMAYEAAGRYAPGSRREARARTQARHYWNDRAIPT